MWSYAAGYSKSVANRGNCPCAPSGASPPLFVQDFHYCESGNAGGGIVVNQYFEIDPLWVVVVVQLVMIVALNLEHHGSTVTSLNLRVELLKQESVVMNPTPMKPFFSNKYNSTFSS